MNSEVVDGRPPERCRPFTADEISKIHSAYLRSDSVTSTVSLKPGERPVAVFLSGLPGSGKTSWGKRLIGEYLRLDESQLIYVDCDEVRSFHTQYRAFQQCSVLYKDLMAWFAEGSGFDKVMFKEDGLMPRIVSEQRSFCLAAILDSAETLEYVEYVKSWGYRLVLVHMAVPLAVALERGPSRVSQARRWTHGEFIRSRVPGLIRYFPLIASTIFASAGAVLVFDDSREEPELVYSLPRLHVQQRAGWAFLEFGAESVAAPHLQEAAENLARGSILPILARFFQCRGVAQKLRFCLAGGYFKSLLLEEAPKDLDLWPLSEESRSLLVSLLSGCGKIARQTQFNTCFQLQGVDCEIEVVSRVHRSLDELLAGFDLALSCMGVELEASSLEAGGWSVNIKNWRVHPDWQQSLREKRILLIKPLPNTPYLLATAERVVRYAQTLRFPFPKQQLDLLLKIYRQSDQKEDLLARYNATSRGGEPRRIIAEMFSL